MDPVSARVAESKRTIVDLVPALDAEGQAPHFEALSTRPWLTIAAQPRLPRSRWFKIRYRLSLYDRPARPMISFRRGSQEISWHLLPGPVLGRGEGLAIAPDETTDIWISPVAQKGRFSFLIEAIEILDVAEVLRLGWRGDRGRFISTLATFALGWRPEAEMNFRWATQHAPLSSWPSYQKRLSVAADLGGPELPRRDWANAPMVKLVARLDDTTTPASIDGAIEALRAQIFPRWTLLIAGAAGQVAPLAAKDARIRRLDVDALAGEDRDLLGFIAFGDRLKPHALACFIETMERAPDAVAAYCDEEMDLAPVFKPDWSPRFEARRPYVGRLLLARLGFARGHVPPAPEAIEETSFARKILFDLGRKEVLHIPRPLIETQWRDPLILPGPPRDKMTSAPRVTIVMPTRDHAAMLRRSVTTLLERTAYPAFDLVIVDNGSTDPAALAALATMERDPRVTRIDVAGPFNFSRLCNLGAARATGEVLVFLNNDIEITEGHWLDELVACACEPATGAVGCMLLYPDGRIQHAGIVVGMGEGGGHCDAGLAASAGGWLQRNAVVHEISAVTGACLAVRREKFLAARGFDELRLPIEFNDIDLCLRLEELGYQTVWTPLARLTHFESASRGKATFRRLDAHAKERAYFQSRWADRLRDDPFYHPGLSLFSLACALA
ncbi:glycosyltransferase family 2 protein [Methylocella tundrae]|uniref:Glycosyl transferase family 2 n=1 Tax=Methylocella tundrae TaxID=227605 RepID=A0A4U8YXQ2_METTU|nr:glycosyltransferase [Methylocella tundrae]WPP05656.1 glycosyltransferase [Methylocella tundrae]VFU08125.1 Glycosyl transferase family 2 [Methylocella tundrae]